MPISLFGRAKRRPADVVEEGWLLYAKPTTLEPVGTLFRIDEARRRFMVDEVTVETQSGAEAVAKVRQSVRAEVSFFARFLGLDAASASAGAADVEVFEFELAEAEREYATDVAMDRAMAPVTKALSYRADNRYFVIRDVRSATAMTYRLTKEQAGKIGGGARLTADIAAGASAGAQSGDLYEIAQTFPERMRVMFLAEEIVPVKSGLAGGPPELGRVPVTAPLSWQDD